MSPVELLGLRFLLALPIMLGVVVLKGIDLRPGRHMRRLLIGSAVITIHFLVQITGLRYTSATNTGWIIAVSPLAMAVLSFAILGERVSAGTAVGIVTATAGVVLLVSRGDIGRLDWLSSVGDWMVLVSAHTWALYTIAIRDLARERHPLAVTFTILVPPTVLLVGIILVFHDWRRLLDLPVEAVVALLFLGIPGTALAQWFWQEGVAELGATKAGVFLYIEPLATTALAVPYLGEPFGPFILIGGLLVLGGVWHAQRSRPRRRAVAPAKAERLDQCGESEIR
jgi:drug/metabolite transporter (DMT)-like permease